MSKFVKSTKVQAFLRTVSHAAKLVTKPIAIAAGAAGTVKNFYIPISPITNSNGTDVGGFGDSSLVFATGVFDVEVACNKKDADLANGEYWINYLTGEGRGKKKTTGTSESATYKYFIPADEDLDVSTAATNKLPVPAEAVSFSAGAAGTTGVVSLDKAPIYNADGGKIGALGDTSFAWITGTVLTTEVYYNSSLSDTAFLTTLTNGQFAIDYIQGRIFYKKATTGTSDTCNYNTRQLNVEITATGVGADVNVVKVGGTAITLGQKTSALSIPVVLPSDAAANSGSASSGDATYMSPRDFTATYLAGTTLTLAGLSFTPTTAEFASVKKQDTTGVSVTYTPDVKAFSYNPTTGVLTVTGAAFTATDVFVVTVLGPMKKYDPRGDAVRATIIDPMNQQAAPESWVNATNVEAATQTYPSADGKRMTGIKGFTIDLKWVDGDAVPTTFQVFATNDTNPTAASRNWIPITGYVSGATGVGPVKGADTDLITSSIAQTMTAMWDFDVANYEYVKLVVVPGDATNTLQADFRSVAI